VIKPVLSVVEAVILECDTRPGKHLLGVLELRPMLGGVAAVLS
jgi:hypothetical protein